MGPVDCENPPIPLPEKLKFTCFQFNSYGDGFQYILMIFMTLFNIMGNDISPTRDIIFWVSSILMVLGFLILGNLIGEVSNILHTIQESQLTEEEKDFDFVT
jgi:hypothetical protein